MPLTTSIARACRALASAVAVATLAHLGGCGDPPSGQARSRHEHAPGVRIASLSPALTECVAELGLKDRIVGRTPWCEGAAPDVPVVGTLLDVDAEALVRCGPTLVLVQPPAQGIDAALVALARGHGWAMLDWRINGLDEARDAMSGLANAVADADPALAGRVRERHAQWSAMLDASLAPLAEDSAASGAATVLVMAGGLEGIAFGRGTYIDDALARLGVRNAIERPGYPALSVEDLVRLSPRTIVVIGASVGAEAPDPKAESLSAQVIHLPADGLAVPGGRLPHGLKALRDALARSRGPSGG